MLLTKAHKLMVYKCENLETDVRVDRLMKLADVLLNFETEKTNLVKHISSFDLKYWHCGTVACAVGVAMLHPWFIERGLSRDDEYIYKYGPQYDLRPKYVPEFGSGPAYTGASAACEFFGITYSNYRHLFRELSYTDPMTSPEEVALRIQEFCAEYQRAWGSRQSSMIETQDSNHQRYLQQTERIIKNPLVTYE